MPGSIWPYGTVVLVRAKIIRVVGETRDGQPFFEHKPGDRHAYGRVKGSWSDWPGHALPFDWGEDVGADWPLEPIPNGHPVVRCRRFELNPQPRGIVIGARHLFEYVVVDGRLVEERRRIDLCEVALPPAGKRGLHKDRSRLVLVHPLDAAPVPLSELVMSA